MSILGYDPALHSKPSPAPAAIIIIPFRYNTETFQIQETGQDGKLRFFDNGKVELKMGEQSHMLTLADVILWYPGSWWPWKWSHWSSLENKSITDLLAMDYQKWQVVSIHRIKGTHQVYIRSTD